MYTTRYNLRNATICCASLVAFLVATYLANKSGILHKTTNEKIVSEPNHQEQSSTNGRSSPNPVYARILADIEQRWSDLNTKFDGVGLESAKQALCEEALVVLKSSPEMLSFLGFLIANGDDFSARWIKNDGMRKLFTDEQTAETARTQLLTLQDPKLKEHWSYYAGLGLPAGQKEAYLAKLKDGPCRQNALSGFCATLVQVEPVNSVQMLVAELKIKEYNTGIAFGGLPYLAQNIPLTANFEDILNCITLETAKSRSFQVGRGSLIQRWSETDPGGAMKYVISNPKSVEPEHLARVFNKWTEIDPNAAIAEAQNLTDLRYQEIALGVTASKIAEKFPKEAWQLALQITSPNAKQPLLQTIYNTWLAIDKTAANLALDRLESGRE
jgi:hypothetical protein